MSTFNTIIINICYIVKPRMLEITSVVGNTGNSRAKIQKKISSIRSKNTNQPKNDFSGPSKLWDEKN